MKKKQKKIKLSKKKWRILQTGAVSRPLATAITVIIIGALGLGYTVVKGTTNNPSSGSQSPTFTPAPTTTNNGLQLKIYYPPTNTPTPTMPPASGNNPTATPTNTPGTLPTNTPVPPGSTNPTPPPGYTKLIFDDEFNGTTLDTSKWNTCFSNFSIGSNQCVHDQAELEVYTPQQVIEGNGYLTLRAEHTNFKAANGKTYQYPSGMISTGPVPNGDTAKFEFRNGYAEMRALLPKGNGLWPAFWMISAQTYPPEIDNFEVLGESPSIINMHFHPQAGGDSGFAYNGPDTSAGWHVYGLDWSANAIKWYVDGKLARNLATSINSNIKLYLIANLAVGGDWPVPPDSTTPFPADFKIDYIRVWQ